MADRPLRGQRARPRAARPLRVGDLLILVAMSGLGLVTCRRFFLMSMSDIYSDGVGWPNPFSADPYRTDGTIVLWRLASKVSYFAMPLLLAWTAWALIVLLRAPRPRWRRLWHQPGFLACVTSIAAFAWRLVGCAVDCAKDLSHVGWHNVELFWLENELRSSYGFPSGLDEGLAVLIVWAMTFGGRALKPERSWVDRAGRAIGCAWIITSVTLRACTSLM